MKGNHLQVSFSKLLQKHLADKHKLTSYVLNSKNNPELINVKKEHDLEEVFESAKADVVMVAGVTLLQNEKLRAQLDFRIFLEFDADQRLAEFKHDLEEVFESAKADVVMVAGVTLLQNEKLRAQLDFRIFLESDADQRLAEFIKKAKKGPDDDVEAIMEQYFTQVKPSYEQTLQWKDHAHFFAEPDMSEEKMGLLGLMIKDMVQKHHELADLLHLH
uniref:PRK domain-containing protein n=1 Tax=Ascaris lumbricoides TaxID=6252 RepID=A0A0M3IQH1_ASCLU